MHPVFVFGHALNRQEMLDRYRQEPPVVQQTPQSAAAIGK